MSNPKMMCAVVVERPGDNNVLTLRSVAVPAPGLGEVLIKVAACGLNPVDVMARRGSAAWMVKEWPFTPGIEHSGRVIALGQGTDPVWLGKRIVTRSTFGGNAEFSIVPASDLAELPVGINWIDGAAFRGASHTAWHLLHTAARARRGQSLLVHSAGGAVGLMLTQMAKAAGLTVIGLLGGPGKARLAAPFGADQLIDYTVDDWPARVRDVVGDAGVDIIVDGNGGATAASNLGLLAPLGQISFIGATSGTRAPAVEIAALLRLCASVSGFSLPVAEKHADSNGAISAMIGRMVEEGSLRVPVGGVLPLADIAEAHRRFDQREIFGRLVISIKDDL